MPAFGRRSFIGRVAVAASLPHIVWPYRVARAVDAPEPRTTPPLAVFKHGTRPEESFYRQVIGKRIGRWYANVVGAFPRAIAIAKAAMAFYDKMNVEYVKARRAQGYFGDRADEDETLRQQFFVQWDQDVFKEAPDFWSLPGENNPSVLGSTHFPEQFKGFIVLARGRPIAETSVTYDHELTHYYLLNGRRRDEIQAAVTAVLPDGFGLEELSRKVFRAASDENLARARYLLQPAEIDVTLAEVKRRFAYNEKKHVDSRSFGEGYATAEMVWAWWAEVGAKQSRESEEPAGVALEPQRFELLDQLPARLRNWVLRRLYEVV